jgi:transketolase
MAEMASTREAFVDALMELAASDPSVALVSADSLKALRATRFAEAYPQRLFEVGIAEQSAVAVAAGLASCGVLPFVGTYSGFITMRACEQVRTFVAYPGLPVKLVGLNGGLYGGEREGVTHQFFEDLGILRSIAGIDVLVPADAAETRAATLALAKRPGPGFLRIGSGREPVIFDSGVSFELGRLRVMREYGDDVAVFACGPILKRALAAADGLRGEIDATVVEVHTLKPLDSTAVAAILERTRSAVTVEDHNVIGGLGSAIAEAAADLCPVPVVRVGLRDTYPESGEAEALLDRYAMGAADITAAIREAAGRKGGL